MKNIPTFDSFINEARITWGEELAYNLNHDRPLTFVKAYEGQGVDIFFTKDGRSAIVTQRTSNLISHGKDTGKSMNTSDVKFVYCGLEKEFYTPEDYKKLLNAVYKGSRNPKVTPIKVNESVVNEGAIEIVYYSEVIDNWGKTESSSKPNVIAKLLQSPEDWTDDQTFEDKLGKPYDIDSLIGKTVKVGNKTFKVEESVVNEGAVKAFEMDYADMVKNIKSGYGWIDPEFVGDTWENIAASIDFEIVKDEVYNRLIKAGLLFFADSEDEEKKGKKVTNISQIK